MTEDIGEIKKRIKDLLLPCQKYTNFKVPLFNNLRSALEGIMEDAKKEFPFEVKLTEEEEKMQEYNEIYDQKWSEAVMEWFKKWFGSEQK